MQICKINYLFQKLIVKLLYNFVDFSLNQSTKYPKVWKIKLYDQILREAFVNLEFDFVNFVKFFANGKVFYEFFRENLFNA